MKQPIDKPHYSVIVIGAGESGIAVGCLLKSRLGTTDFRIFDRQGGIGGAWYINRYPGVACDIPALFYSYSFSPNYEWTSLFPPGEEIQQYLEGVCGKKKSNILDNIQLNTEVSEARWVEQDSEWEVRVTKLVPFTGDLSEFDRQSMIQKHGRSSVYLDTELIRSKILVTCAGELVEPNSWPRDVPGIESFQGDVFHSARWKSDVTLTDKNVVVVGTGCTSAQLVPSLTKAPFAAKSVTQLMRAPPWVMPRPQTPPAWVKHSSIVLKTVPGLGLFLRYFLFLYAESTWLNVGMGWFGKKRRQWFQGRLLSHLKKTVPEKYHEILTPQFGVGCRRIIIDGGWLECLNLSNVELTTRPLVSVGAQSIVLGPQGPSDGDTETVTKPADVIILANGFETSTYLHRIKVQGTNGVFLHDVWNGNGGPGAYLSTAVHGFPNFFMVLGPNSVSGHSSAILASENIAGYALNFIKIVLSEEARTVEVRRDAEQEYTAEVQKRSLDKVWQACRNGYIQEGGWNSSICPFNQVHFSMMCRYPNWKHWDVDYTAKGIAGSEKRVRRYSSTWALVMIVVLISFCTLYRT